MQIKHIFPLLWNFLSCLTWLFSIKNEKIMAEIITGQIELFIAANRKELLLNEAALTE